ADIVLHIVVKGEEDKITDYAENGKDIITVYNKCDMVKTDQNDGDFQVSAKTGEGVQNLAKFLASKYSGGMPEGLDLITCERHVSALNRAKSSLESAIVQNNATIDCVLIDLRSAYNSLLEITGGTATEDIVDRIFSAFCVGK
ncbi:MAG: hypothetical protein MJ193_05285, partial [Clostridia bacterium]|nr:hypothetical protein [Clostridia bacterium]